MKYDLAKEDFEDHEQERLIQQWLKSEGRGSQEFVFTSTNSKGRARHSRVRGSFSLDAKIQKDSSGTFGDIIAGSDGRDLLNGDNLESALEPKEIIGQYLSGLFFQKDLIEWLIMILKLSINQDGRHWEISQIDSEW